jgi:general secretion pathway protein M
MNALARPQTIALAALGGLIALCAVVLGIALQIRVEARDDLDEKRAAFARFSSLPAARAGAAGQTGRAPAAALIDAPTQGQAGAQLQAYLSRLARSQGASVMSSGIEGERKGEPEAIRVQATLETSLGAMQILVYELETGTPYVVIESLSLQPATGGPQSAALADPPLRVVLVLRAMWRRGTA